VRGEYFIIRKDRKVLLYKILFLFAGLSFADWIPDQVRDDTEVFGVRL
jgi:hypothetical protein